VGCGLGGGGFALDADNRLYVLTGHQVRRLKRAEAKGCAYEEDGPPIELPAEIHRSQRIDGPLVFRSGGVEWRLVSGGQAVYAHDFMGGVYRIDSGRAEPVCTDVFGFQSLAVLSGRLLTPTGKGIQQLELGAHCRAHPTTYVGNVFGGVFAVRDRLYHDANGSLERLDGRTHTPIAKGAMLGKVVGLAPCGNGLCIADWFEKLVVVAQDGRIERKLESFELFATRIDAMLGVAAERDGSLLVLARHRDSAGDRDVCESAVYELPAKAFAL
jgi:hypothetical protein